MIIEKKENEKMNKTEIEFFKTLEWKILEQGHKAYKKKSYIETAVLSWSIIEEIYIPRIIGFIDKKLKIGIPSNIFESKTSGILIDIYFCISHDKQLYEILKKGNSLRNKLIHQVVKQKDLKQVNKLAKDVCKVSADIMMEFIERFDGKKSIPVLMMYANGWNDCREKTTKIIKKFRDSI